MSSSSPSRDQIDALASHETRRQLLTRVRWVNTIVNGRLEDLLSWYLRTGASLSNIALPILDTNASLDDSIPDSLTALGYSRINNNLWQHVTLELHESQLKVTVPFATEPPAGSGLDRVSLVREGNTDEYQLTNHIYGHDYQVVYNIPTATDAPSSAAVLSSPALSLQDALGCGVFASYVYTLLSRQMRGGVPQEFLQVPLPGRSSAYIHCSESEITVVLDRRQSRAFLKHARSQASEYLGATQTG